MSVKVHSLCQSELEEGLWHRALVKCTETVVELGMLVLFIIVFNTD